MYNSTQSFTLIPELPYLSHREDTTQHLSSKKSSIDIDASPYMSSRLPHFQSSSKIDKQYDVYKKKLH